MEVFLIQILFMATVLFSQQEHLPVGKMNFTTMALDHCLKLPWAQMSLSFSHLHLVESLSSSA